MADYDCDFCCYNIKCKIRYEELDCPYNAIKAYPKDECKKLFDKANEVMKSIDELKLLDHEEIFEDIIEGFRWQLGNEIIYLVSDEAIKEWEEMINE